MTNKIKIIDDKFFDKHVLSMMSLVNALLTKSISKYQYKNPLVICKIVIVNHGE